MKILSKNLIRHLCFGLTATGISALAETTATQTQSAASSESKTVTQSQSQSSTAAAAANPGGAIAIATTENKQSTTTTTQSASSAAAVSETVTGTDKVSEAGAAAAVSATATSNTEAPSQERVEVAPGLANVHLVAPRVQFAAVFGQDKSSTYTGVVSWQPRFLLKEDFAFGFGLGYSRYRKNASDRFNVLETTAGVDFRFQPEWSLEGQFGVQNWLKTDDKTGFVGNVNIIHRPAHVERGGYVAVGYSFVKQTQKYHALRIGVGAEF
jgi:hypothetical protein